MAALKAHFETVPSREDDRTALRRKLNLAVLGTMSEGRAARVLIHNLSTTGLLIETAADLRVGDVFEVEIPNEGSTSARVIWSSGSLFGCEFAAPVRSAAISAALLKTPPRPLPTTEPSALGGNAASAQPKLTLRTRALIIVGFCLVAWALIIAGVALIL